MSLEATHLSKSDQNRWPHLDQMNGQTLKDCSGANECVCYVSRQMTEPK